MEKDLFFNMIQNLREQESVLLYQNLFKFEEDEKDAVIKYLTTEFEKEKLGYPFISPKFNSEAALWSAQVVYIAAQLLLYRKTPEEALINLFPNEVEEVTPETMLSADLCLRFLPSIVEELRVIDPDDKLVGFLDNILKKWMFSAVDTKLFPDEIGLDVLFSNQCLTQLYLNRIVKFNNTQLAKYHRINSAIKGNLGLYYQELWPNYKELIEDE